MVPPDYEGPYLLGIDYGTESCRTATFDLRGNSMGLAVTPYGTKFPRPGQAEQSSDDQWEALKASMYRVLDQTGIPTQHVAAICTDATTTTVVALDEEGNALCNAIMWMDVRTTEQVAHGGAFDHWAKLYSGGGTMPVTAEWYSFKATWLKDNEPEIYRAAYWLVDVSDWITYKLTGRWTANLNTAVVRAYYNRDHGGWPVEFYEAVGCGDVLKKLPEDVLPLGQPVERLSVKTATDLGLTPGIPVIQGGGDAWHGQIGLGAVEPGSLVIITGSSQVMSDQSSNPVYGQGLMGGCTDAVVESQYTVEGSSVSSDSVLKWFENNFARSVMNAIERIGLNACEVMDKSCANIPPGSDGLIVNEYFRGNRTPYTDSKARGLVWGLSLSHTAEHFYHAIMGGITYGTAHNLKAMTDGGFKPEKLAYCGGATKPRVWMQMYADVTGISATLTEIGGAVVLGSCMLAAVGVNLYPTLADAARNMVHESDVIESDMNRHEEYKFFVQQYMDAWPQMAESTHKTVDHISQPVRLGSVPRVLRVHEVPVRIYVSFYGWHLMNS